MPRKNGKNRRTRRRNGNVHTNRAPTMQGMQQVGTWRLQDFVPLTLGNSFQPDSPVFIEIAASVNGWNWVAYQQGVPIAGEAAEYGSVGGQFAELTALWATYRLDAVRVEFIPNNTGSGAQSATIHAIDPAGDEVPLVSQLSDVNQAILSYSRLRSTAISRANNNAVRRVDYRSWMTQCAPQPYLQTLDSTGTGQRVFYPTGEGNTAPVIRMSFQTTPGVINLSQGLSVGLFRVYADMTVRGRRAINLTPVQTLSIMTPQQKDKMMKALESDRVKQGGSVERKRVTYQ